MVEVHRPSVIQNKELRSQLDRLEMQGLNLHEIKAKLAVLNIKPREFEELMRQQCAEWHAQIIQDAEVKSDGGSYPEPRIGHVDAQDPDAVISDKHWNLLRQDMNEYLGGRGKQKAIKIKGEQAGTSTDFKEMTPEEVRAAAEGAMDEWTSFMDTAFNQIIDAQMARDYQTKMGEINQEIQRIITLAKQGVIGPEFVLLALAKVNVTKNGIIMSGLGKKLYHANDQLNKVAASVQGMSSSDPNYAGQLQYAQSRTRDGSFQMQQLTTTLQQSFQNVAGTLEQVQGYINEINRTRREIITKVSAQ